MLNSSRHPSVRDDIDAIVDYCWDIDPDLGIRFHDALEETVSRIEEFPEIGSVYRSSVPKLDAIPIRSHTIPFPDRPSRRPYSLFYRADNDEVRILYIYATRRNVPQLMRNDVRI